MPTNLHTRDFLISLSKSTTWNTVNQPGANEGQLILSEDLGIIARESLPDEGVGDRQAFIQTTDKGSYPLDKKNIRQSLITATFYFKIFVRDRHCHDYLSWAYQN